MSGVGLQTVGTRIRMCSACETPLPLREATEPELARVWICSHCGAEISGVLVKSYSIDELRGVRPEQVNFDAASVVPICGEMLEFAKRLIPKDAGNVEKRSSCRHPLTVVLTALELDEQLQAMGAPFQTITRNLSTGGICLINNRAIRGDFLALELKGAGGVPIQTLAHVLRRRPIGPYHDIGTEFVTKFASSNPKEQNE